METLKPAVLFLLVVAVASTAEAQRPAGIVHVNGTLYCSSNGASSFPLTRNNRTAIFHDAVVQVRCTTNAIANAPINVTTNSKGAYLLVLIPHPTATVSSIVSGCRVHVLTPLSRCNPGLPSAGLVSSMRYVGTVHIEFWYITYLVASSFTIRV